MSVFELRQRRGELQGRNQRQPFAVEQAKQQLEHVLAARILAGGEEHARVVARRRLHDLAGIDRAAVGKDRHHQPVVADVLQILHQPRAALVERVPIVEAAVAGGVERLGRGKILGEQRPIEVPGPQPVRRPMVGKGRRQGAGRLRSARATRAPGTASARCPAR